MSCHRQHLQNTCVLNSCHLYFIYRCTYGWNSVDHSLHHCFTNREGYVWIHYGFKVKGEKERRKGKDSRREAESRKKGNSQFSWLLNVCKKKWQLPAGFRNFSHTNALLFVEYVFNPTGWLTNRPCLLARNYIRQDCRLRER